LSDLVKGFLDSQNLGPIALQKGIDTYLGIPRLSP